MALSAQTKELLEKLFKDSVEQKSVLSRLLFDLSKSIEDMAEKAIVILLANLLSLTIKDDDPNIPFCPMYVLTDGRSFDISDLLESDFDNLYSIIEDIEYPLLQARIAHVFVWPERTFQRRSSQLIAI